MLFPFLPLALAALTAVTIVCGTLTGEHITLSDASITSKWVHGSDKVQIVEVTVSNNHPNVSLVREHDFQIQASGESISLINPGQVHRLLPGQSTIVQLGIKKNAAPAKRASPPQVVCGGGPATVTVTAEPGLASITMAENANSSVPAIAYSPVSHSVVSSLDRGPPSSASHSASSNVAVAPVAASSKSSSAAPSVAHVVVSSMAPVAVGNTASLVASSVAPVVASSAAPIAVSGGSTTSVDPAAACYITLTATFAGGSTSTSASGTCGVTTYTTANLKSHSAPQWYDDAKFGIFIHWGLYSIPAYGGVTPNEVYSEWYWFNMANPNGKGGTYAHHEQAWGKNFNYDDFMPLFTATAYDPAAWMKLFSAAGAKYIVPVTKHHEGFTLFNHSDSISTRSVMHYGAKRDLLGPLLAEAKANYPDIHRGTYFSMPEWFNPAYKYSGAPAGFSGGPTTNPFTGASVPYTGYVPVVDFVKDIQLPQMEQLAYTYETELMWCDIGGPSDAGDFAAAWFNYAASQGRQVAINNRCGGGVPGDFSTPEYATNSKTKTSKWESNRGMDPFSFGWNAATPLADFLTGEQIVRSLVDIVSKNGNLLLDVGPKGDGSIADVLSTGLTDTGSWLIPHGESIYSTKYWSVTPGLDPFRYTTTATAFYIHINTQPTSTTIRIPDPIPYVAGDKVTVLGGSLNGTPVSITINSDGSRTLTITDAIIAADKYVWTFKITY